MRFPRICFVRHCEERSDAAISKQMLGMTIYYKPKVYYFEKKSWQVATIFFTLASPLSSSLFLW